MKLQKKMTLFCWDQFQKLPLKFPKFLNPYLHRRVRAFQRSKFNISITKLFKTENISVFFESFLYLLFYLAVNLSLQKTSNTKIMTVTLGYGLHAIHWNNSGRKLSSEFKLLFWNTSNRKKQNCVVLSFMMATDGHCSNNTI